MPVIAIVIILVLVLVAAFAFYEWRSRSAACSPPCSSEQVCVKGQCQTSCYSWGSYSPSAGSLPSGIVGYAPDSGLLVPVGAQGTGGWYLGGTDPDPEDGTWGEFIASGPNPTSFPASPMYYVTAAAGCPSTFAQTANPAQALTFNGMPVCWDFGGTSGVFTPYVNGACDAVDTPGGTFSLVANPAAPS